MDEFKVVVTGEILSKFSREQVAGEIARIFQQPLETVEQLLSGKPVVVKRGVDEPTANLDRHARAQIVALLQKTVAEQRTVVVACHDREIIDLPGVVRLNLEEGELIITK